MTQNYLEVGVTGRRGQKPWAAGFCGDRPGPTWLS